jgi:hypothetical protein
MRVFRKDHHFLVHYIGSKYRVFRRKPLTDTGRRQPRVSVTKHKKPTKKQYEDPLDFSNFRLHRMKPSDKNLNEVGPFFTVPAQSKLYYEDLSEIFDRLWQSKQLCNDNILDITESAITNPKAGDLYAFRTDNMKPRATWRHYVLQDTYHWKTKDNCKEMSIDGRIFLQTKCTAALKEGSRYSPLFKKYITQDIQRNLVLIHYMGNEEVAKRFAPHGNDKSEHPMPFIRRNTSVNDLIDEADNKHGGAIPASILEAQLKANSSKGLAGKLSMEPTKEHIAYHRSLKTKFDRLPAAGSKKPVEELFIVQNMLPNFVHDITLTPGNIRVHLATHTAMDELARILEHNRHQEEAILFHYDTSYKFGNFYLSTLCIRHPFMEVRRRRPDTVDTRPIMPVAFFLHERRELIHHNTFLEWVQRIVDLRCTDFETRNFTNTSKLITTDQEFKNIPWENTHHNYCWKHLTDNVIKNAGNEKHDLNNAERTQVMGNIYSLRGSKSRNEYDEKLLRLRAQPDGVWTKATWNAYYDRHLHRQIADHSGRWHLEECGYFRAHHGLTNNASETLNFMMRHHSQSKRQSPGDLVLMLNDFAILTDNDIDRAYYNDGKYTLLQEYKYLEHDIADRPKYSITKKEDLIDAYWKIFHPNIKRPEQPESSMDEDSADDDDDQDEFRHPISKAAHWIVTNNNVQPIANLHGHYTVIDSDGNVALCRKDKHGVHCQQCNTKKMCYHKLAVLVTRGDRTSYFLRPNEIPVEKRFKPGQARPGSKRQTAAQEKPKGIHKKRKMADVPPNIPPKPRRRPRKLSSTTDEGNFL